MNSTELVTPKNIQVGKFYLNKQIPGIVYVGTGKSYTKQKTLICVRGNQNIKPFFTVFSPSECPGVWFNFYLAPDQELIKNEIFK